MKMIELPNGTLAQIAEYKNEEDILEYQNNPLIEALPPIYSQQEVIDRLCVYPPWHKEERYLEDHKRVHFIQRLLHYFQPLPIHLSIQSSIDRLLRNSYVSRNPLSKEYAKGFVDNWNSIQKGSFDTYVNQTGQTLTIIGASGVGKTRTLQRILKGMIPQVISHTSYQDEPLNLYQINHITIQTPFDGGVKTIIYDFMYQYDLLMGTSFFERYANSRLSTSQLMPIMAQIAKGIGLLLIDEIQHLKAVRNKNSTEVLNFLTTLINTVNIPILMIGTPKAMEVLQSQFRQARRSTNAGNVYWDRMKKDEIWDLFFRGMWKYQWTQKESIFSEEFSSVLYDQCQGIPDIAIKLYMMVQLRAISNSEEEISIRLIKKVAQEELKIVQPMLQILRSNNFNKLAKYDDLFIPSIENFIEQERMVINQKEILDSLNLVVSQKNEKKKLYEDAVFRLGILGIKEHEAKATILDIIAKNGDAKDLPQIVQEVFRILTSTETDKFEESERDLRKIIRQGKENGLMAYQSLYKEGVIKQDYPVGDAS